MTTAALGELAEINPKADRLAADAPVSFVGMAEMDAVSAEALPRETRPYGEVAKGYTQFRNGDILVAKITGCWENNKTGVARLANPHGAGSTEFHVVRPRAGTDVRFLLHFLRQPSVTAAGKVRMTGSAGQKRVPVSFLEGLRLSLPPVEEQRRIAAILDQADAIRTRRRKVLAYLDALTGSTFYDMFEEHAPSTSLEGSLEAVLLDGLSNGLSPSNGGEIEADVLTLSAVTGGKYDPSVAKAARFHKDPTGKQVVRADSFLISRGNGNPDLVGVGVVAQPDPARPLIFPDTVIGGQIDRSRVEPSYLAAVFGTDAVRRQVRASVRTTNGTYKVNQQGLGAINFPLPPLRVQRRFSERVEAIENQRAIVERALDADDKLFASVQFRAFRGEL